MRTNLDKRSIHTYQFEISNASLGSIPPVLEKVGTAPEVFTYKFNAVTQTLNYELMVPLNWDQGTDMQLMCSVNIPNTTTLTVDDLINLETNYRVTMMSGETKLDDAGSNSDVSVTSNTAPFIELGNDNVILSGKNTDYYTYMPHIIIPKDNLIPGAIINGEIKLKSIAAGNVPVISIYQIHLNYYGY